MTTAEDAFYHKLELQGAKLENLLKRRFFVAPSFEIYGSAAGLFDFGPNGCAVKNEFESLWRRHFVHNEDLLEICGPNLTPHAVLKASGHVDRFQDFMCEDVVTKECFRTDKILEQTLSQIQELLEDCSAAKDRCEAYKPPKHTPQYVTAQLQSSPAEMRNLVTEIALVINQLEGMSAEQMYEVITKYGVKSPAGNELSKPYPFNLMFATKIGPKQVSTDSGIAYLRPETAQGIFVNFRRLLEQNNGKMPFGAACVGTSFRNEIAPRNGLLRVREFPMAEIEFFCDPSAKSPFPKFPAVADLVVPLYNRSRQLENSGPAYMSLRDAVASKVIDNETLAYFIGRTYLFLMDIGINPEGFRFRQHLATEMAHYASDCWDAEILTSYKWVECVGIADRSAYDLTQHTKATKVDLLASRVFKEPKIVERFEPVIQRKLMGPVFKKDLGAVLAIVESLNEDKMEEYSRSLLDQGKFTVELEDGRKVDISKEYVHFEKKKVKLTEETYVPNVIEPSFGIGRLLQAVFEHSFRQRDSDEERTYLALPPRIAPIKCSILPISNQPEFQPVIEELRLSCLTAEMSVKVDSSNASIGKRYARTDELGIPFGVTIDFQTLSDQSVTMRELVSMEQIRLPLAEVAGLLRDLVRGNKSWSDAKAAYPIFTQQQQ